MAANNALQNILFTDRLSRHKFIINSNNPTSDTILQHGIYEWPLIQWCQQFMKRDKIFIDIGAHMGTYSIHLAPYCKEVHAFEALTSTYYNLCGGIALNNLNNVKTHNVALSTVEHNGQRENLYQFSTDGGGNTLDKEMLKQYTSVPTTHQVEMRSLDSYLLSDVGFLKIDVEGWELQVLKGAVNTLSNNDWPQFIFEAWPQQWYATKKEELFQFIYKLGYKIIPIKGINNMFITEHI